MHTIKQLVNEIQSGNTSESVHASLQNAKNEAPYASLVYILRAMNVKDPELRFQAAIYSPDRGRLKQMVNAQPVTEEPIQMIEPGPVTVTIPKKVPVLDLSHVAETKPVTESPQTRTKNIRPIAMWKITPLSIIADNPSEKLADEDWKLSIPSQGSNTDISTPLSDYIKEQTSLATKKSKEISASVQEEAKSHEADLVNKFLAKPAQILRKPAPGASAARVVDLKATKSLHSDENLVTETLAKLHLRQNHRGEAIQIYEQLCLRYPEKSRYFMTQIQKIKENEL